MGKRSILLLPVILLILAALACPGPAAAEVGSAGRTLRIGILAPLSGPYASGGSSFLQAAQLAAERANEEGGVLGRRVELAVADTQGRVEVARSETLRLISREKAFAIVGAYLSEETIGVIEAASATRTPVVVPVAATGEITDRVRKEPARYRNVFRVGYSIPQWAAMMAEFLKGQKVNRYAFVGAAIRWNRELAAGLKRTLLRAGIEPVYEAFYSPGNPAFEPVAVAAAAARPDIVVLGDPGKNSVAFVKRMREIAPAVPILSVGGTLGDARIAATLPLDGPLYVQAAAWRGSSDSATRYVETFEKRYGYAPVGYSDTLPYDALTVLVAAIRKAGKVDGAAVILALEQGAFPGVAGTYRFDAAHQARWGTAPTDLHGTVIAWRKEGSRIVFPRAQPAP
ncbi:MAG: ABC transporter substrate-binding protein [Deltaproteobacteria bacterium]|nr:ABC transporter substrate-binding protein [Deltaproteobacteria bacterium]